MRPLFCPLNGSFLSWRWRTWSAKCRHVVRWRRGSCHNVWPHVSMTGTAFFLWFAGIVMTQHNKRTFNETCHCGSKSITKCQIDRIWSDVISKCLNIVYMLGIRVIRGSTASQIESGRTWIGSQFVYHLNFNCQLALLVIDSAINCSIIVLCSCFTFIWHIHMKCTYFTCNYKLHTSCD